MRRFTNKIVVITGGTSGIGLAAAKQFIKEGAKVVVTGRSPQSVGDAQKEIGDPEDPCRLVTDIAQPVRGIAAGPSGLFDAALDG
jgi:NADP-dependent 3-hydroxy acid dehydrogenase YdfG